MLVLDLKNHEIQKYRNTVSFLGLLAYKLAPLEFKDMSRGQMPLGSFSGKSFASQLAFFSKSLNSVPRASILSPADWTNSSSLSFRIVSA